MEIITGRRCPYCGNRSEYIDSREIYSNGKSYGMVYICRPCGAWVGVHKGTDNALGRLANAELRRWKRRAHAWFDPLWKKKMSQGFSRRDARNAAYAWLAVQLGIIRELCHIGMFDVDHCKMVISLCQRYHRINGPP